MRKMEIEGIDEAIFNLCRSMDFIAKKEVIVLLDKTTDTTVKQGFDEIFLLLKSAHENLLRIKEIGRYDHD